MARCRTRLPFPPISTYSIVARDPDSGQMGVAIQSHYFSVGSLAPSASAGVGAAVVQSFPKVAFGTDAMEVMLHGHSAAETLKAFLDNDPAPEYRQVALVDANGGVAAHTGSHCVGEAGHHVGEQYACQANMMAKDSVWRAMARAYERSPGDLGARLMAALRAAQAEGGDIRGCQSAALIVVAAESSGSSLKDRVFDLRVEDHPTPLRELERLLALKRAYRFNSEGEAYLARRDFARAERAFTRAEALAPGIPELVFWRAVALVNAGYEDRALPLFAQVFAREPGWVRLIPRLGAAQLLPDDDALQKRIAAAADRANT